MTLFSFKSSKALSKSTKPAPSAPSTATANGLPPSAASDVYADIPAQSLRYWPLEASKREIRVLQVHRGWKSDPMICRLYPVSLLDEPRPMYETVSYCWGNTSNTAPIKVEVNGVVVAINASAADAIHRIRTPFTDRWIWIDAICINQNDKDERSQQVRIMGKIYVNGFKNIVWLGPDERYGPYIQQEIDRALSNAKKHTRRLEDLYSTTHSEDGILHRHGTLLDPDVDLNAMLFLFSRPWFRRLWIVQEVVLAPNSICYLGWTTFELKDILRVAVWLSFNYRCLPVAFAESAGLKAAVSLWFMVDRACVPVNAQIDKQSTFSAMRFFLWDFKASQPRDYVFAVLGLLVMLPEDRKKFAYALKIDYRKPISAIFCDYTRAIIKNDGCPRALEWCSCNAAGVPEMTPSWSLGLSGRGKNKTAIALAGFSNASKETRMESSTWNGGRDAKVLCLKGILVDDIANRTELMDRLDDPAFYSSLVTM